MSEQPNPYAPPRSELASRGEDPDDRGGEPLWDASAGTRFLNLIIDSVCRALIGFVGITVFAAAGIQLDPLGSALFSLLSILAYYVLLEGFFGMTVGKAITGTRVVALDGGKPGFLAVIGRTMARFVPFEPFSFLGSSPVGWHDRWSGTRVISVRRR
jgi:uncharacterized RDD family membrane protein YckC